MSLLEIVLAGLSVGLLAGALALIPLGLREGDRPNDLRVLEVAPAPDLAGVRVRVVNPGGAPALIGLSLRRPGLRLALEAGTYARLRTRATSPDLLAGHHAVIAVVGPGEEQTLLVPGHARSGRRAELVLVAGQTGRLRVIHRAVRLSDDGAGGPVAAPRPVPGPNPDLPLPSGPPRR